MTSDECFRYMCVQAAMDLLDEMTEAGLKMDAFTYAHAIEACCNARNRVRRKPREIWSCRVESKKKSVCLEKEERLCQLFRNLKEIKITTFG